jgi:hypothetical protein
MPHGDINRCPLCIFPAGTTPSTSSCCAAEECHALYRLLRIFADRAVLLHTGQIFLVFCSIFAWPFIAARFSLLAPLVRLLGLCKGCFVLRPARLDIMPPKAPAKAAPVEEPEDPAKPLTEQEKIQRLLKKLPDLREAGDIKAIVEGMGNFEKDPQVQVVACRQLNKLVAGSDAGERRDLLWKVGGLQRLVKAHDDHLSNTEAFKETFIALCHMSNTQNLSNTEAFGKSGAIERVLKGMHSQKSDIEFQRFGCLALHHLAVKSANVQKISDACGIERILAATEAHAHEAVQLHGCGALQLIAISPENRGRIVAAGGIDRLLNAMIKHPDNIQLAEIVCGALVNVGCATQATSCKLTERRSGQSVRRALQHALAAPEATENTKSYGRIILDALPASN